MPSQRPRQQTGATWSTQCSTRHRLSDHRTTVLTRTRALFVSVPDSEWWCQWCRRGPILAGIVIIGEGSGWFFLAACGLYPARRAIPSPTSTPATRIHCTAASHPRDCSCDPASSTSHGRYRAHSSLRTVANGLSLPFTPGQNPPAVPWSPRPQSLPSPHLDEPLNQSRGRTAFTSTWPRLSQLAAIVATPLYNSPNCHCLLRSHITSTVRAQTSHFRIRSRISTQHLRLQPLRPTCSRWVSLFASTHGPVNTAEPTCLQLHHHRPQIRPAATGATTTAAAVRPARHCSSSLPSASVSSSPTYGTAILLSAL